MKTDTVICAAASAIWILGAILIALSPYPTIIGVGGSLLAGIIFAIRAVQIERKS